MSAIIVIAIEKWCQINWRNPLDTKLSTLGSREMNQKSAKKDECFILVKAQPHRSSKYFETVCCAGVGRNGKWRRQYPVPFRILNDSQKFRRWDWIEYEYTTSADDRRTESQKVIPESLVVGNKLKTTERARFLNPLIRASFSEADSKGESLTMIRPEKIEITWVEKSTSDIAAERDKHAELARQMSLFDSTARPLVPCPLQFTARWRDSDGKDRNHECDDWETSTAFNRFERIYGRHKAIRYLQKKYEEEYFHAGLALAFSTHSRRNITFGTRNQWLLVGLIRVDLDAQGDLLMM